MLIEINHGHDVELSNEQQNEIRVRIFKALADPGRLAIIQFLNSEQREIGCGEIGDSLNIPKTALSYHLKTLRESGLTFTRKEARERFITLNEKTFKYYLPGFLETLV
ncbi:ArsR/SmtB family transcription factor [Lactococcus lactis]|uniref:ArsR/SmtB family transcription factor n=1 Tax=Lactococcus lactis TaxID=1358 RepID=UPI0011113146|nr:metalloregulator ArsR/SmtB family transcription factor [Lactococcus lactis]